MAGYFVEGADVLENKLGIDDPVRLKKIETEIVYARMIELTRETYDGEFNFRLLKHFHYCLFSDIYYMAGQVRSVRIAKGNSVFCYPENIEQQQRRIFGKLKEDCYLRGFAREEFLEKFADLAGELNALHPFREGNGRAIKLFLYKLAQSAGWHIDYGAIDASELMEADIAAFYGDPKKLMKLIDKNLCPWEKK